MQVCFEEMGVCLCAQCVMLCGACVVVWPGGRWPKPVAYLTGDGLKIEARQFNYVSQFEYGTERRFLRMEEALADVGGINPLHQVTPENHISHN